MHLVNNYINHCVVKKFLVPYKIQKKKNIMSKNHQSIISIRVAPEGNVTREESSSIQPPTKNGENISILQQNL